jgi:hypothetical protein
LLVLISHAVTNDAVRGRLDLGECRRRHHHTCRSSHIVDRGVSDQVSSAESVEVSSILPHTIVASKPVIALLSILVPCAIAVGTMRVALDLGEVLWHRRVILRNLSLVSHGTCSIFIPAILAVSGNISVLHLNLA